MPTAKTRKHDKIQDIEEREERRNGTKRQPVSNVAERRIMCNVEERRTTTLNKAQRRRQKDSRPKVQKTKRKRTAKIQGRTGETLSGMFGLYRTSVLNKTHPFNDRRCRHWKVRPSSKVGISSKAYFQL
jgi:hypothetical protein